MPDKVEYEHGARKSTPLTGRDPHDDFSQDAAGNRKPPLGLGLTERVDKPTDKLREDAPRRSEPQERPARDTRETPTPHPDDDRDPADTAAVPKPRD